MSASSRGHARERAVKAHLEGEDWWVCRAAGSLGDADLVALKAGRRPLLVEVKCSSKERGPYADFGPSDRLALLLAGSIAGADVTLAWWPPHGPLRFFNADEWPEAARASRRMAA